MNTVKRNGGKKMSKNLIPEICKMLGVELGEEFKVKDKQNNCVSTEIYKFSEDSLLYRYQDQDGYYTALSPTLYRLFRGDYEVIKLPWKPKEGEKYWGFWYSSLNDAWVLCLYTWGNNPADFAFYKAGWAFHTKKEAKAALPTVAKEMGVEYKL